MKELGIEVKDSEGNMKPLDILLQDMRKSFANLSEDQKANAAATIFGKEAMSGMLAVLNASESDFNKLTKAIDNSEGVAQDMADTMQNNLQGKLINLKSALEELAIKIFDALEPALTWLIGAFQELIDWLNGLGKGTQTAIVAIAALAAAIGPLMVVLGTLLTLTGGFMTMLPTLVPLISALAPPIGIVVGALTALGVAFALTREKADESYKAQSELAEQNYELAVSQREASEEVTEQIDKTSELIEKTNEQIEATDGLVDTYEELANKSKLTTDEFGEFLTLQSELENTKSPERISEIESRMEKLREKSGLSREEFDKLISSNSELAELFPEAGQAVDDYGNKIMDTTGKLKEMTQAEIERMQLQIYNEMIEGLQAVNAEIDQYESLLGEVVELEDQVAQSKKETAEIQESIKSNETVIAENEQKILDLKEQQKDASLKEWWNLDSQILSLQSQNHELDSQNKKNHKNLDELNKSLATNEKTLSEKQKIRDEIDMHIDKNRQNYDAYTQILGKQFDINIEKGKENKAIDEAIKKRQEEIKKLESLIKSEGDSNGKKQEAIEKLKTENSQLKDAKGKLDSINGSLDKQTSKYDTANNKLAKVNGKFQEAGGLTDSNIKKADIWNGKLDKNHNKKININQTKDPDKENEKWAKPVSKVINFMSKGLGFAKGGFAKGSNYTPSGPHFLGEEGPELVEHNGKFSLASFGLYDMPQGAKVYTNDETIDILRGGLVDGIGRGLSLQTIRSNRANLANKVDDKLLQATLEQNKLLMQLLRKDPNIIINKRDMVDVVNEENALDGIGAIFD